MRGCDLVIHTASPFFISGFKDAKEQLINPAKLGTRNVLETARQMPGVKRVVLTSSVAAIYGDNVDIKETARTLKHDTSVTKNYLTEKELKALGRIVNAYLDLAH